MVRMRVLVRRIQRGIRVVVHTGHWCVVVLLLLLLLRFLLRRRHWGFCAGRHVDLRSQGI
jgi:hypothetical protein